MAGPLRFAVLLALQVLVCGRVSAEADRAQRLSQRKINEMAAALETARLALIEDTGLRRPGEPLAAYFDRVIQPQAGEPLVACALRVQGYIDSLSRAADATAAGRHLVAVDHTGTANRLSLRRAAQALSLLPVRVDKLKRAARHASQTSHFGTVSYHHWLGAQFNETLELVLAAYSALRDARS